MSFVPHRLLCVTALVLGSCFLLGVADAKAAPNPLTGKPVVGRNADGHLEVFTVNPAGELRHRWQKPSNGDWAPWCSLGADCLPGIAVVSDVAGRLLVFAVENNTRRLKFIQQLSPNGSQWSAWTDLGGQIQPPLAAARQADGRVEVFAVNAASNSVSHIWQADTETGWWAWATLGGNVQPGPVAAQNRDGRLELFGIDATSKTLVHCWQRRPNDPGAWSDWADLGGTVLPGFAVGKNVLGRLEVFVVHTNQSVYRICQQSPASSEDWGPWLDFGGKVQPGLAVGQSADGRLEIIAVGQADGSTPEKSEANLPVEGTTEQVAPEWRNVRRKNRAQFANQAILHRWETLVDGSDKWSKWTAMGEFAQPFPAVGQNEDGDLEIFAVAVNDSSRLNHRRQISNASDWLDWSSLDHATIQYGSRTWRRDEGLPNNVVQAIAQTPDGYLWIGTREGLARFDGVAFTIFNTRNLPQLGTASITALCADHHGRLWIGTEGAGLVCVQGDSLRRFATTNGLAGNTIRAIYERKDGSVWIGTTSGLSRYLDGRFRNYTRKTGLFSDLVSSLFEDSQTNLWIATGLGLNRLRGQNLDSFVMPNGLPNDSVRAIWQDRGGRIWVGSNNGMLWYSWIWKIFYPYNTRYGLSDTFVSAICEDREGNLWVGTYSGLNRFREGRFFGELDNEGVPFDRVNTLFEDREGNLWVGSMDGLVRLAPQRFSSYTRRQGLSHNHIMAVTEDPQGNLWAGTWGGGLNCLKEERVTMFATTNGFSSDLILSVCDARDGSLWVGADFDGGVSRLQDGRSTHYDVTNGLLPGPVRVISQDDAGRIWFGTSHGLSCLAGGRFTNYSVTNGLVGNNIRAICPAPDGAVWVGTDKGLTRWQQGRFSSLTVHEGLSDNAITALRLDQQGTLWIGTAAGGLNRYRDGQITQCTTREGLLSDEVFEILEDQQGWLWMSCSRGIFRVRKQEVDELASRTRSRVACIAYGKADGMETTQCTGAGKPAGCKTMDGRLWFPTTKGLVTLDPAAVTINTNPPLVYIEQVIANRKTILGPRIAAPWAQGAAFEPQRVLVIPPGSGELELHYTALNLQAPESCRFKYKLEGIDSDWVEAGQRRVAYYNNVSPGRYQFRVQACNRDGFWNEAGAACRLQLQPHLWQTWWCRGAAALLMLGLASGGARYATQKRMHRELQRLEQRNAIERERGRIAKDIHDDLGSSLTRIMMLSERVEEGLSNREEVGVHVNKIVSSARHTVQSLDEIVWAVNPENDTLEGLVEYISHYADEFFEDANVSCRLEIPVQLPALELPAEVRHDLFLVVKEAFNNVLKHAQASAVRVEVSATDSTVEISIEDNGRGFDPSLTPVGSKGNGLGNMRRRVETLGGRLAIQSAFGQGTKVRISSNLSPKPSSN